MAENETKKKPTTKKTTSTRKKKVEEKPKTETMNLNEVKEELNINDDIKVKNEDVKDTGFFEATPIEFTSVNTVDQKINSIKETVGNNMKSIISVVNANANNSIITTKAESSKTNTLIKEKFESINNNLVKIEELLKNNDAQKLNPDDIKTALDHFRDNIESLYSSVHEFIDEDEKIFESIDEKYNVLYKNISLITDAIVNDDEKSVEDLLVAQNQYIKDLMEKNNERINLNSERMNIVISQMGSLTGCINGDNQKIMKRLSENADIIHTTSEILNRSIDDSLKHGTNQLDAAKNNIIDHLEQLNYKFNKFVISSTVISILIFIMAVIGLFT